MNINNPTLSVYAVDVCDALSRPRKATVATMDASKIMGVLTARSSEVSDKEKSDLKKLMETTTEAEQLGLLTTLRRGGTMEDATDWLQGARSAAEDMDNQSYELALSMYGDSTVLAWRECLEVAPALTYRSPLLEDVPA